MVVTGVANVVQRSRLCVDICIEYRFAGCNTRRLLHIEESANRLSGMSHGVSRAASSLSQPIEYRICGSDSTQPTSVESFSRIGMHARQTTVTHFTG